MAGPKVARSKSIEEKLNEAAIYILKNGGSQGDAVKLQMWLDRLSEEKLHYERMRERAEGILRTVTLPPNEKKYSHCYFCDGGTVDTLPTTGSVNVCVRCIRDAHANASPDVRLFVFDDIASGKRS